MKDQTAQSTPDPESYEPPCVERVLTVAELEHEILYAGDTSQPI